MLLSVFFFSGCNEDTCNHKLTPILPCHLPCLKSQPFASTWSCLALVTLDRSFHPGDTAWHPVGTLGPFCQLIIFQDFSGYFYDPGTVAAS